MSVPILRLLLARHGTTIWNREHRYQGTTDIPLSDLGRAEARALGARLATVEIDAAYASGLQRAQETARLLLGPRCDDVPLRFDARLNELHFGELEGLTWAEGERRFPREAAAWLAGDPGASFPGGESPAMAIRRVGAFLADVTAQHPRGTVLIVSHGGPLRLLLCRLLDLGLRAFWRFDLAPASLSRVHVYGDSPAINLLNDTCHLEEVCDG